MPFSNLAFPSVALAQLQSVLKSTFGCQISVEVLYLKHDFAQHLGVELYSYIANSLESLNSGLGDWFFRQSAFPEQPDNTENYFNRYSPGRGAQQRREQISQKKCAADEVLEQLISKHDLEHAQLVGFTSVFMQNTASFAMARKLKQRNPELITVIGGANCEFPMGAVIAQQVKHIDYVFSGPALKSLPQFVGYCLAGEISKASTISGVFAHAVPLQSGLRTLGEELNIDTPIVLDYAPFVSRIEEYFGKYKIKPILTFETSRGCWWGARAHCTFCGLNNETLGYRAMKPEIAIELFNSLFSYSDIVSHLVGVDNIMPKNYPAQVLPLLDTPQSMDIFYEVKADLTEQDMAALARARVTNIQPGIEALATSTLKLMKKGTTAFQNLKLLKLCALYGISPYWNLLVGFPGEGEEVFRRYIEVIPLLTHLYPPSGAHQVRFDRFSPYFYDAPKYQLKLRPLDCYFLIYPFQEEDIRELAYYFMDQNIEENAPPYIVALVEWIDELRARVAQWRDQWKDPLSRPRLFLEESDVVYDSRSGSVVEHRIGETGRTLLLYLAKPTRISDLVKTFSEMDVVEELARLQEKGFLFQEEDRFFSLVIESDSNDRGLSTAPASDKLFAPAGVQMMR